MAPDETVQSATDLKICFIVALFMLAWELVLMFHKHHFLNLLCLFLILSIFFLNYFDKNYMKFLLIMLAFSLGLDIIWLGVNAQVSVPLCSPTGTPCRPPSTRPCTVGFSGSSTSWSSSSWS